MRQNLAGNFFMGLVRVLVFAIGTVAPGVFAQQEALIHHSIRVTLDPVSHHIAVDDTITFPPGMVGETLDFLLNSNLEISQSSIPLTAQGVADSSVAGGINSTGADTAASNRYSFFLADNAMQLNLSYQGILFEQAQQNSAQYSQSFSETSGIVDAQGVYLNGASLWLANFSSELITFDLQVEFAETAQTWTAVSQGSANGPNAWRETNPMEEVYLIAADFTRYAVATDDVEMLVYLRQPEPNLAAKYLDATERYLALYEPMLGDYPFDKFALIENFWETGYGMPSFTLLGQQIIRFPFIIDSSYPHEILHNWWGNGVYPDYASGNWSEGLTAYLADHLFQEMNGLGAEYRKDNLIRYKNYVADEADFPLTDFTSRSSAASQAVGYGKTMMLWHMLRLEIGDESFLRGLRQLYSTYKFQQIGFDEIAQLFSQQTQRDLQPLFDQWVNRVGAPRLQLSVTAANNNQARIRLAQLQNDAPYSLNVPAALYYADAPAPKMVNIPLSNTTGEALFDNYSQLQAVVVDPYFDMFRQLDRAEIPSVIGQLFGATQISFIIPAANREDWLRLAESFAEGVDADILLEEDLQELPADRSVWILGKDNRFAAAMEQAVADYAVSIDTTGLSLSGSMVEFTNRSSVLTARHPLNDDLAIGWLLVDDMVAMPGIIEKLPHYGKYSYLSFIGEEPTNDVKGIWTSANSPLQWLAPSLQANYQIPPLPVVAPLAQLPAKYLPERLERHVLALAAEETRGRAINSQGAAIAASYIATQFRESGLQTVDGSYLQQWTDEVPSLGSLTLQNVVGMIPGTDSRLDANPVVIGAHYDHLGEDADGIYYGADDNASGVSIMLEVAAKLQRAFAPKRPILFVAFSGEESGLLGSRHFVENPPKPYQSDAFFAMINLDSVGRLNGRSLQVFGSDSAYEWPFMAQGIGFTIGVPSTMVTQLIAGSDHVSFINEGIPAIHLFAGVHDDYHKVTDTAAKLDLQGMSDIALWLEEATVFLADREAPLRVTLEGAPLQVNQGATGERAASLGSVPDFAYEGAGIRISDVTPDGAAAVAGLVAGDVLLSYNGVEITDLQAYSNLIRQSAPGDVVEIQVRRGEELITYSVTLKAR